MSPNIDAIINEEFPRLTKIVATVGPTSNNYETILKLAEKVDIFRINFSHGSHEEHMQRAVFIRQAANELGRNIELMADMPGAKFRIGQFENGGVQLKENALLRFYYSEDEDDLGNAEKGIRVPHADLLAALKPGYSLVFGDGYFSMKTEEVGDGYIIASTSKDWLLKSGKGINAPQAIIEGASFTEKDREHATFALDEIGVDLIVQSFVKSADEVRAFKDFVAGRAKNMTKVETRESLRDLDAIIAESESIMVGRGDLAVEIGKAKVPIAQREIVHRCRRQDTFVIVATGMAESGGVAAECGDISQATYQMRRDFIFHGKKIPIVNGGCMLSIETAAGKDPLGAVALMDEVILNTEAEIRDPEATLQRLFGKVTAPKVKETLTPPRPRYTNCISHSFKQ